MNGGICVNLRINKEGKVKLLLSFTLLAYALYVTAYTNNFFTFVAMLLSTIGDIAIMNSRGCLTGRKEPTFNVGVCAFSFAHMAYVCAMLNNNVTIVIALLSFSVTFVTTLFQPKGKKWNNVPYTVAIFNNAINAWLFGWVAGTGMVFFITSDLILSVCEEKSPKWQIPIWATYVPAQAFLLTALLLNGTI